MTDGKRVYDDGKMFLRKLQRFLNKQADLSSGQKNFKRITIAEPHRQEKHRGAMYRKSDSDDAGAIALATLNMLTLVTFLFVICIQRTVMERTGSCSEKNGMP